MEKSFSSREKSLDFGWSILPMNCDLKSQVVHFKQILSKHKFHSKTVVMDNIIKTY